MEKNQNIQSKIWDREAIITGTTISADGTIVSYDKDIGGNHSTRHRKFFRKFQWKFPMLIQEIYPVVVIVREQAGQGIVLLKDLPALTQTPNFLKFHLTNPY